MTNTKKIATTLLSLPLALTLASTGCDEGEFEEAGMDEAGFDDCELDEDCEEFRAATWQTDVLKDVASYAIGAVLDKGVVKLIFPSKTKPVELSNQSLEEIRTILGQELNSTFAMYTASQNRSDFEDLFEEMGNYNSPGNNCNDADCYSLYALEIRGIKNHAIDLMNSYQIVTSSDRLQGSQQLQAVAALKVQAAAEETTVKYGMHTVGSMTLDLVMEEAGDVVNAASDFKTELQTLEQLFLNWMDSMFPTNPDLQLSPCSPHTGAVVAEPDGTYPTQYLVYDWGSANEPIYASDVGYCYNHNLWDLQPPSCVAAYNQCNTNRNLLAQVRQHELETAYNGAIDTHRTQILGANFYANLADLDTIITTYEHMENHAVGLGPAPTPSTPTLLLTHHGTVLGKDGNGDPRHDNGNLTFSFIEWKGDQDGEDDLDEVLLVTGDGDYLCADTNNTVQFSSTILKGSRCFWEAQISGGRRGFKNKDFNRYLQAHSNGQLALSPNFGNWEKFERVAAEDPANAFCDRYDGQQVRLQTSHGLNLRAGNANLNWAIVQSELFSNWELFWVNCSLAYPKASLRTAHGRYLRTADASNNQNWTVNQTTWHGSWELFTPTLRTDGTFTFETHHGTYLDAQTSGSNLGQTNSLQDPTGTFTVTSN